MLVVNADDLGHDRATSDAICEVFARGAITSASAMVFMEDSERAFGQAAEAGLPIGLHLNLMEPYSGADCSEADRAEQAWAVERFQAGVYRRWVPGPRLLRAARHCARMQLAEFGRLRGAPPTHVDGHQHGHLATPVLWELSRTGVSIRPSFTFRPGEKPGYNRALRSLLNRGISSRFVSTQRFHAIRDLHPALGGSGIEGVVAEAREIDIEVMVHPGFPEDFEVLVSEEWGRMVASVPTGSYADLQRRADRP